MAIVYPSCKSSLSVPCCDSRACRGNSRCPRRMKSGESSEWLAWVDKNQPTDGNALCACLSHCALCGWDVHAPVAVLLQVVSQQLSTCTWDPFLGQMPPSFCCRAIACCKAPCSQARQLTLKALDADHRNLNAPHHAVQG